MKRIVIEVEPNLKPLVDVFEGLLDNVRGTVKSNPGGRAVSYAETERIFERACAALECGAHAVALDSLDIDVPRVSIGGNVFDRIGRSEATFFTMAGTVRIERCLYREAGVRNGKTVDPIALRIGAIGEWLPRAAQGMAYLVQQGTERPISGGSSKITPPRTSSARRDRSWTSGTSARSSRPRPRISRPARPQPT